MTHHEMSTEAMLRQAIEAFNQGKFGDYGAAFGQGAQVIYPQSGERIVGRDRIIAACEANPSSPRLAIQNIQVSEDLAVLEADEFYDSGDVWSATSIFRIGDGMIAKATCYFGRPFEAATWRKPFVE